MISTDQPQTCSFRFLSSNQTAGTYRDENIHREPTQELEQHKYQMKYELRHDICFTEVWTRLSPTLR